MKQPMNARLARWERPRGLGRRSLLAKGLLGLGTAAVLLCLSPGPVTAGADGTIGSLPAADGGDGTQSFYLTGPRSLVSQVIIDAYGSGYYVPINLPGNQVWLEFYGDVTVVFDEQILDDNPSLMLGISAGFAGGGMLVMTEVDGKIQGRRTYVEAGFSLNTPYDDLAGLLTGQFALITLQRQGLRRGRIDYASRGGALSISQDL